MKGEATKNIKYMYSMHLIFIHYKYTQNCNYAMVNKNTVQIVSHHIKKGIGIWYCGKLCEVQAVPSFIQSHN